MYASQFNLLTRILLFCVVLSLVAACGLTRGLHKSNVYRVRSGDTLYAISWRYQIDYKALAGWNKIRAPYIIHPGQELVLFDPGELPADQKAASRSGDAATQSTRQNKSSRHEQAVGPSPKDFQWPTSGKIVRKFAGRKSSSQGIDIAGKFGQPIHAAASGRVVYSGNGLTGYGNLIILKHSEVYLSAYAHNSKLHVKEGETIKAGQQIASMGYAEENKPRLHFEVRKQGRPVDPLKYLPRR